MKQSIQAESIVSVETVIAVIYSYCWLQAWVLNDTIVIDHCGHNSNSKTARRVSHYA